MRNAGAAVTCVLFLLAMLQACEKPEKYLKDDIQYFREHLRADMDFDDIVDTFGTPPVDLNEATADIDGLHIYQYPLFDTTYCRIGYMNKIVYACLIDSNYNIVEDVLVTTD